MLSQRADLSIKTFLLKVKSKKFFVIRSMQTCLRFKQTVLINLYGNLMLGNFGKL